MRGMKISGVVKRWGVNMRHIELPLPLPFGIALRGYYSRGVGLGDKREAQVMRENSFFKSYPVQYSTTPPTSKLLQLHQASSKKLTTTYPSGGEAKEIKHRTPRYAIGYD